MPSSAIKRITNYRLGLKPEQIKEVYESKKDRMVAEETEAINRQVAIENRVRGILAEGTVPCTLTIWYISFAREVDKLHKHYGGGGTLLAEVAIALYKWKTRGLDESFLNKIRDEVFAIPAPAA
jgi:hypothetical protein